MLGGESGSCYDGNIVPDTKTRRSTVLPVSKLNNFIFGYFDPEIIFLDNENK